LEEVEERILVGFSWKYVENTRGTSAPVQIPSVNLLTLPPLWRFRVDESLPVTTLLRDDAIGKSLRASTSTHHNISRTNFSSMEGITWPSNKP